MMNTNNGIDNYGWESSLSMVANEQTRTARHRHGVTLLRPVFMNAVEVGYSYAHCDRDKKLNVRGVTIALWHFICRGHQAIALLPYCFKNYAEKSSRYSELMMLYRLNLIEFTPGYGSEKYAEVNRIMVNRAYETGGCLVARSQMQGITENKNHLIEVVEQRLLMPTFNGDDIMFPIDGPLGRNGPSLKQTLECEQNSTDWRSCSEHQLLLSDQRHWLEKLALLVPEKVPWTRLVQVMQAGGESSDSSANIIGGFDPLAGLDPPTPPSPPPPAPIENPFNRAHTTPMDTGSPPSFTHHQPRNPYDYDPYHPGNIQHHQHSTYHLPNPHQLHRYRHQQQQQQQQRQQMTSPPRRYHASPHMHGYAPPPRYQNSSTRLILRYGPPGSTEQDARNSMYRGASSRSKHSAASVESTVSTQSGGSRENENPRSDEDMARSLSAQLLEEAEREATERRKMEAEQKKKDEMLAKLSQIFGYSKSARVMEKFPDIATFCLLVEKCIHEVDQVGDGCEFEEQHSNENENEIENEIENENESESDEIGEIVDEIVTMIEEAEEAELEEAMNEETEDLIDFSEEPLNNEGAEHSNSIEEQPALLVDYFL